MYAQKGRPARESYVIGPRRTQVVSFVLAAVAAATELQRRLSFRHELSYSIHKIGVIISSFTVASIHKQGVIVCPPVACNNSYFSNQYFFGKLSPYHRVAVYFYDQYISVGTSRFTSVETKFKNACFRMKYLLQR